MKKYLVPEIDVTLITTSDILAGSDTIIEIGGLYGEGEGTGTLVSEYTGEPIEE